MTALGSLLDAFRTLPQRWFGQVWPEREPPPLPHMDAREHALRRLREYLSLLVFSRTGESADASPIRFSVPIKSIHTEMPDEPQGMHYPGIGMIGARGAHDAPGLGPLAPFDETLDVYGPGTVLLWLGEYTETIQLEIFASFPAERRALLVGITSALRINQWTYTLHLSLPSYYDQTASFVLIDSTRIDDPDVIKGRRRALIGVQLTVPEVLLVNTVTMQPLLQVVVQPSDRELDAENQGTGQ